MDCGAREEVTAELATILIQTGALGLCAMLIFELRDVRKAIAEGSKETAAAMLKLAAVIYDHKARAGDTPPARMKE